MNIIKENFLNPQHWIRLLFIILFTLGLYFISFFVLLALIVIQFVCALITGSPNEKLAEASKIFSAYITQIIDYLTYNSDEKPWPFNDVDTDQYYSHNQDSDHNDQEQNKQDLD